MTGTVQSLTPTHVTISGVEYSYGEACEWLLQWAAERGSEIEVVVVSGRIVAVAMLRAGIVAEGDT